ncbi:MAG: glycosyltransferase family 2 protein [Pirellulales bacterium]|nr:glycosyltransferase family 2 protein [Pirellulales bacterium]
MPSVPSFPPLDEACISRVGRILDLTEQAIAIADQEVTQPVEPWPDRRGVTADLKLSVVIPVYNERETIRELIQRVRAVGQHDEIILVDDYSTDGTRDILLELDQEPDIRVLMHGYNRGKGAALRTAFERVRGDVVVIQDADLEYDPADYERLLKPIRDGKADVVYGSRFLDNTGQDPSRMHRFGNWLLTAVSNLTTGQRLTDMETCYKVFRRRILHAISLKQCRFGFEPEVTAKVSRLGYQITEVPIRYNARNYAAGKKIGWKDAASALWCIFRYAWKD